jgi:DNA-binding NtrC family response regulator
MRNRILIVDNDEKVLIELERSLEQAGYETETAWNLPEGIDALADGRFHLLLVGDHPPELNCERVLRVLAREGLDIPVIVMHTRPRHPFAEAFIAHLGAAGVVCKWDEEDVVSTVRRCLGVPPQSMKPPAGRAAEAS